MNDEKSFEPGPAPRIPVGRPESLSLPAGYRRGVDDLARARQQVETLTRSQRGASGGNADSYDAERALKEAGEAIAKKERQELAPLAQSIAQRIVLANLALFYFRLACGLRVNHALRELVELRKNCFAMIDANIVFSSSDAEAAAQYRAMIAEDLEKFFVVIEKAIGKMDFAKAPISGSA
ncbi:MAG TPA: hypothetical protein VIF88_12100 [Methylocystis sp.]